MIEKNVDLKKYNTYGIGGTTKYLYRPENIEDLKSILEKLNKGDIPWYILGAGSNIILPDEDYKGAIIKLDKIVDFDVTDDNIYASSGLNLGVFINKMLDLGFTNYAPLMGIPGSLGGAIVGNAGSFGKDLFSDLISVRVLLDNGSIKDINKEDISYSYRNTEFKESKVIIIGATFKALKGDVALARNLIKENLLKRSEKQPLEYKNAGSVFKNPEGYSAGFLIEQAGFKGYQVGDACVSLKHANFIVNLGSAKAKDILKVIQDIKIGVKEKFNVDLELEQIIVEW